MSHAYLSSMYDTIASVQEVHFWFRARNNMIASFIRRTVREPYDKKSFLEIGCGTGIVMHMLESMGFVCTGLDINKRALFYAAKRVKGTLLRQSIFTYKPSQRYDVIGAFDVLEHIKEDARFLQSCRTMLVESGTLLLTVPAGMWLWSDVDKASGHVRRYEKSVLTQKLVVAGFRVHTIRYWNSLLLPLYALWHHHSGLNKKDVVAYHVQKLPTLLNTVFAWVFACEQRLSRLIRFPFGATLVVCAQKI
jgi:2-polyprenyl-3-methyl-5-hydroxy-6-metoxy-1,4-benzoquinol methylase